MAKNNKPKKKYVPKPIFYPKLVVSINAFDPLEKALDKLLTTQTIQTDSQGTYIYFDGSGKAESFEAGLRIYAGLVEIYGIRTKTDYNVAPLRMLREHMLHRKEFTEELIEEAVACLALCRDVVNKIPAPMRRDILVSIQTTLDMERLNITHQSA